MTNPRNRGQTLVNIIMLILAVIGGVLFLKDCTQYYRRENEKTIDTTLEEERKQDIAKLKNLVQEWEDQASLVVVGKIISFDTTGHEKGLLNYIIYGFLKLEIESVERGHYGYKTIYIYIGWLSSLAPAESYDPLLKRNYYTGDRVRVYLNYDMNSSTYYTPGAYYTIEPLS